MRLFCGKDYVSFSNLESKLSTMINNIKQYKDLDCDKILRILLQSGKVCFLAQGRFPQIKTLLDAQPLPHNCVQVKKALTILIKHNIVSYSRADANAPPEYFADITNILKRKRYPKYVCIETIIQTL